MNQFKKQVIEVRQYSTEEIDKNFFHKIESASTELKRGVRGEWRTFEILRILKIHSDDGGDGLQVHYIHKRCPRALRDINDRPYTRILDVMKRKGYVKVNRKSVKGTARKASCWTITEEGERKLQDMLHNNLQ